MSVEVMKKALTVLNVAASYAEHQQMAEFFEEEAKDLRQAIEQAESKSASDCDSPSWCNQYGRCHRSVVGAPMLANCMEGQEPIGWITDDYESDKSATTYDKTVADRWNSKGWPVTALYTEPPKREWQGLTYEEISASVDICEQNVKGEFLVDYARAIEAKLKEKNK